MVDLVPQVFISLHNLQAALKSGGGWLQREITSSLLGAVTFKFVQAVKGQTTQRVGHDACACVYGSKMLICQCYC